jgi:hypothetical protein
VGTYFCVGKRKEEMRRVAPRSFDVAQDDKVYNVEIIVKEITRQGRALPPSLLKRDMRRAAPRFFDVAQDDKVYNVEIWCKEILSQLTLAASLLKRDCGATHLDPSLRSG